MNDSIKTDMDVSIVVIGYNEAKTLGACLMSVKQADLRGVNDELIFVDGGSTDNSMEIARGMDVDRLLGGDLRRKAAENRNLGLRAAKGQFIQFVDGDMRIQPDWILSAHAFLMENPHVAAVCGHIREVEKGFFRQVLQIDWSREDGEIHSCGGAAMWRRDILLKMGGFPEDVSYGEEPYLCWRIRNELGLKIYYINKHMVDHDLGFSGFLDYWRRDIRCGETYVEIAVRCYGSQNPLYFKETVSNFAWGAVLLTALSLMIFEDNWTRLLVVIFFLVVLLRKSVQMYLKKHSPAISLVYALHTYFSKIPLALGGLLWLWKRFVQKNVLIHRSIGSFLRRRPIGKDSESHVYNMSMDNHDKR